MSEPLGRIEKKEVNVFEQTVEATKRLILSARKLRHDWTDPEAFAASFLEIEGYSRVRRSPEALIDASKSNWEDFVSLKLGIAAQLEDGGDLSDCAKVWLIDYLRGNVNPPKKKAGRRGGGGLPILIYIAVKDGVGRGLTATRNEAAKSKQSACDAVARALAELKLPYGNFDAVKDIWEKESIRAALPENQLIEPT